MIEKVVSKKVIAEIERKRLEYVRIWMQGLVIVLTSTQILNLTKNEDKISL